MSRAALVAQFGGSSTAPAPAPRPLDLVGDQKIVNSASNLRAIGQAMLLYSNNFKGMLPPDFGTLHTTTGLAPQTFVNPRGNSPAPPAGMTAEQTAAWINATTDYVFRAPGQRHSRFDGEDVLAYENPADNALGINLLFGDGHVEFREMRWALESVSQPLT